MPTPTPEPTATSTPTPEPLVEDTYTKGTVTEEGFDEELSKALSIFSEY